MDGVIHGNAVNYVHAFNRRLNIRDIQGQRSEPPTCVERVDGKAVHPTVYLTGK